MSAVSVGGNCTTPSFLSNAKPFGVGNLHGELQILLCLDLEKHPKLKTQWAKYTLSIG